MLPFETQTNITTPTLKKKKKEEEENTKNPHKILTAPCMERSFQNEKLLYILKAAHCQKIK